MIPPTEAMKILLRFLTLLAALTFTATTTARAAVPVVSNLTAAQRFGTKLVDITYDVTADTPTVTITVAISSDGGTTWSVPATTVTGAVGANVPPGMGKTVIWGAGADWNEKATSQMQFRVTADDLQGPPIPEGFALIPAGNFQMGDQSNPSVGGGPGNEWPAHSVFVSAFYMAKYEVTTELWIAVRAWGLTHGYTDLRYSGGGLPTQPVRSLTWYDMVKWCNARSEQEGLTPCYYTDAAQTAIFKTGTNNIDNTMVKWTANGYRLPTEAEWEKAARGGLVGKNFPWGDTITHSQANYLSTASYAYDVSPTRGYHPASGPAPSPVGSFAANGYGLYDMAGNVWEWCWDWYGTYTADFQTDPQGATTGSSRVLRGGNWYDVANNCRTACRYPFGPSNVNNNIGLRIVRR